MRFKGLDGSWRSSIYSRIVLHTEFLTDTWQLPNRKSDDTRGRSRDGRETDWATRASILPAMTWVATKLGYGTTARWSSSPGRSLAAVATTRCAVSPTVWWVALRRSLRLLLIKSRRASPWLFQVSFTLRLCYVIEIFYRDCLLNISIIIIKLCSLDIRRLVDQKGEIYFKINFDALSFPSIFIWHWIKHSIVLPAIQNCILASIAKDWSSQISLSCEC